MKYLQPKPPGHHQNGGKRGNADSAPSIQASISGIHFFVGAGASHRISNHNSIDDFLETANYQMIGNLVQHHHGGFAALKENSGDHGRSHVFLKFELEALILLYHPITQRKQSII
jgi:hypothetical protein